MEHPGPASSLLKAIRHGAHLLPAQGPIGVFIHHNTLHAFEEKPFEQALRVGADVFGCETYLTEDRYRTELGRGRIHFDELRAVLAEDLGDAAGAPLHGGSSRLEVRLAMLEHPMQTGEGHELEWFMAETSALLRVRADVSQVQRKRLVTEMRRWKMRMPKTAGPGCPEWMNALLAGISPASVESWDEAQWEALALGVLWQICADGVTSCGRREPAHKPSVRHRDFLMAADAGDADTLVHAALIPLVSAFLDQGVAEWTLPGREAGFYNAFIALHRSGTLSAASWQTGLAREAARLADSGMDALASIGESLRLLGVAEPEWDAFLGETFLALRGWGGMVHQIEERPDRAHRAIAPGSLVDFLAVRLVLDRLALAFTAREAGLEIPLENLRQTLAARAPSRRATCDKQRAFFVFQLAQVLGWAPESLHRLDGAQWSALLGEIESFDNWERRRVFHLAYERRFRNQVLDTLAARGGRTSDISGRPSFQSVFCLDEREESIRRHIEETDPRAETFGAAGFFGVVMYYKGAGSADYIPLCPAVVKPAHWVMERVDESATELHVRRAAWRKVLGKGWKIFETHSQKVVGGFFSSAFGLLATVPLVLKVVFPRLSAQCAGHLGRLVSPPEETRLTLERAVACAPACAQGCHGFVPDEMIASAERILRDIGLTNTFARLVFVFGHGSTSANNPHESAHNCGACGGGVGEPNARAIAQMLNDPRVRTALAGRGIQVPADTWFIGGLHDTSNDDLTYADLHAMPESHLADLAAAKAILDEAVERNAHERVRRFDSAPLGISKAGAKRHIEGRAHDLSQVRPEFGHATNALCIVGRRSKTRGLFLDRRAFLTSYDPTLDTADHAVLARLLAAAVPVCGGINLEYYFSSVDSPGWGCGTKLPHNITGLHGVMDGAQSDLRTGLPWQMVEIHEPVRLLFVIETTPKAMLAIMAANPTIARMVGNGWVKVALMDPHTGALSVYTGGTGAESFVPYAASGAPLASVASSKAWYAGLRDHLEFAEIAA